MALHVKQLSDCGLLVNNTIVNCFQATWTHDILKYRLICWYASRRRPCNPRLRLADKRMPVLLSCSISTVLNPLHETRHDPTQIVADSRCSSIHKRNLTLLNGRLCCGVFDEPNTQQQRGCTMHQMHTINNEIDVVCDLHLQCVASFTIYQRLEHACFNSFFHPYDAVFLVACHYCAPVIGLDHRP